MSPSPSPKNCLTDKQLDDFEKSIDPKHHRKVPWIESQMAQMYARVILSELRERRGNDSHCGQCSCCSYDQNQPPCDQCTRHLDNSK